MTPALLDHFAEQARFCDAYGSPFTASLIEAMARDLKNGGPTAELVGDWPRSPRADAVSLRLAGALHMAALSGRDPALAAEYPALQIGLERCSGLARRARVPGPRARLGR